MTAARATLPLDELRDRYLQAQLRGDRREAVRLLVEDGLRIANVVELQVHVIRGAQEEIGRLWQQNCVTIAQEHMASAISQLSLAALFERALPSAPLGKKLLLACVEGELHDLPARIVADFLDLEGFDVRYLGANVPQDDLVRMAAAEQPDVIGLSVTMSFNVPALREAVPRLRGVCGSPIFIGGHATRWCPNIARDLGVEAASPNAAAVISLVRRLAGVTR